VPSPPAHAATAESDTIAPRDATGRPLRRRVLPVDDDNRIELLGLRMVEQASRATLSKLGAVACSARKRALIRRIAARAD